MEGRKRKSAIELDREDDGFSEAVDLIVRPVVKNRHEESPRMGRILWTRVGKISLSQ